MMQISENEQDNWRYTQRMQMLFLTLLSSAVLLFLHCAGETFSLYWMYWWFDILVHTIGGFTVGLFVGLFTGKMNNNYALPILVACVVLGWEFFEVYVVNIPIIDMGQYLFDTVTDILFGFLGACLAYTAYRLFSR